MRRQRSVRSDSMISSNSGEQGFWPSYADMMSAVALILFFLMLLSYVQNLITGNNLQATQELLQSTSVRLSETEQSLSETEKYLNDTKLLLADTELELDNTNSALLLTLQKVDDAEGRLSSVTAELDNANIVLASQQTKMTEQEKALAAQQLTLSEQQTALSEQEAALAAQALLLAQQDEYLKAANEEIVEMRSTMQSLSAFRLDIFKKVSSRLTEITHDPNSASVSDNGSLLLNSGVMFDVASFEVKPEAHATLNQLATVFSELLADGESAKYIDSIVISGHTDSDGTEENNLTLSTNRANSVLNYLLTESGSSLEQYRGFFSAAGYGESRPIATNDTEAGKAANRRIEISIILRDDSIMDIVNRYLDINVPQV